MKQISNGLVLFVVLSSVAASAGASTVYPYCVRNTDGSGYCSGSFEAFRKSPDASDYATFYAYDHGYKYFAARSKGLSCSCSPAYGSTAYGLWQSAMSNSGAFLIQWNSAGVCTNLALYNGSQYQSGW